MAEENRFGARLSQRMLGNIEAYLACCQLGITMASLGLGWVGEPTVSALLAAAARAARHARAGAALHLVPDRLPGVLLAAHRGRRAGAEDAGDPRAGAGVAVDRLSAARRPTCVLYPLNWLLNAASRSILRLLGIRESSQHEILTDVEIEGLVEESAEHGKMAMGQAEYIHNVFRFGELAGLRRDGPPHRDDHGQRRRSARGDRRRPCSRRPYTRVPLWRESAGEHRRHPARQGSAARDPAPPTATCPKIDIAAIARQPWFVPDIRPLSEQLKAFRRRKTPLRAGGRRVRRGEGAGDARGHPRGDRRRHFRRARHRGDRACGRSRTARSIVDGAVPIRDLNRAMDWSLPDEEATTDRRAGHPRGALDPGSRARASPSTASASGCCEGAQPHHRAARHAAEPEGAGREGGVRVIRLGEGEVASAKGFLPLAAPHPRRCTETASWLHKKSCRRAGAFGVSPVTVSRLETANNEPEPATLDAIVKILGFPRDFFFGDDIDELTKDAASFRSLTSMTSREREAALAAGQLAYLLSDYISERFNLPPPNLIDLSHERDAFAAAQVLRQHWALGEQPIQHDQAA